MQTTVKFGTSTIIRQPRINIWENSSEENATYRTSTLPSEHWMPDQLQGLLSMGSQSWKTPWGSPSTLALSSSKANPNTRTEIQDTAHQLVPNHPGTIKQTERFHTLRHCQLPSPLSEATPGHACAWRTRETKSRRTAHCAPPMAKGAPHGRQWQTGGRCPPPTRAVSQSRAGDH